MNMVKTLRELRAAIAQARAEGKQIRFVPTMGNLLAGHVSLVQIAAQRADFVVASIFVNPLQFGAGEDLDKYPRTLAADQEKLLAAGCHLLFHPDVAEIYPHGMGDQTRVSVPGVSEGLCGASRPGHFEGVATVVSKLFNMVQPDLAVFGEKDYQQLAVIRALVQDLNMPIQIIGAPTQRAEDGLALSSRNGYLSETERAEAVQLSQALRRLADQALAAAQAQSTAWPAPLPALEQQAQQALAARGWQCDYLTVRRRSDLQPPQASDSAGSLVVLGAARLGHTRLIDNLET